MDNEDPWHFPPDKVFASLSDERRERFLLYLGTLSGGKPDLAKVTRGISPGLVGAANGIVIDDEGWYWPGRHSDGEALFSAL